MAREIDLRLAARTDIRARAGRSVAGLAPAAGRPAVQLTRITLTAAGLAGLESDQPVPAGLPAGAAPGVVVARALEFLGAAAGASGLEAGDPSEFSASPYTVTTNSGGQAVYAQQLARGLPIFQVDQTVVFAPDGSVQQSVGTLASVAAADLSSRPAVTAGAAVTTALAHLRDGADAPSPDAYGTQVHDGAAPGPSAGVTVTASFPALPQQPTVLAVDGLGESVVADLVWFPLDDTLRLAWHVLVTMPAGEGRYLLLVDAAGGEVLYCTQLIRSIGITADVFPTDPSRPRRTVPLPLPVSAYGIAPVSALPPRFPYSWVGDLALAGVDVIARSEDTGPVPVGDGTAPTTFSPADPTGAEQWVLNAFYFNSYMHDLLYLVGFRESDGNFQLDDFGLGGAASDRVEVRAYPGPVWATANMSTPVDGVAPTMKLGIVAASGRHTALDASVVFHEATHGLTSRLVGGALNNQALVQPQSAAMGEGWSDFVSCQVLDSDVVGAWVVNDPAGIRGNRYDASFPATFADVGRGRYTEMHAVGEVWCAALMAAARGVGKQRALSLLVDSLKLCPANPSMIDARDALLLALDHDLASGRVTAGQHDTERRALWGAFARAGLGPAASCEGATYRQVVADFTDPTGGPAPGPAQWSAWGPAGAPGTVPPSGGVAATGDGTSAELFVMGGDGRVYTTVRDQATGWRAWTAAGPSGGLPPRASIAAAGDPAGATDLFIVGGDGRLYLATRLPGGSWTSWAPTGPPGSIPATGRIAATGRPGTPAEVYAVGADGRLYATGRDPTGRWRPWAASGAVGTVAPSSSIAAVGRSGAALTVVAVSTDGRPRLSVRATAADAWSPGTAPAGALPPAAPVAAVGDGSGSLQLFVVGGDGRVYTSSRA